MERKIFVLCTLFGVFGGISFARDLVINKPASLAEDQELILQNGDAIIFEPDNKKSEIRLFDSSAIKADSGTIMVEGLRNGNPAICVVPISEAKDHVVIGNEICKDSLSPSAKILYTSGTIEKKPPQYLEMFRDKLCNYIAECNGKLMTFTFPKLSTKGATIKLEKRNDKHNNTILDSIKEEALKKMSTELVKNTNKNPGKANPSTAGIISDNVTPIMLASNSSPEVKITRSRRKPKQP
ncbi:MAG: hypothetical protein LBB20_03225 [Puniceicoccales bacterium]|jgi:hypothetical protein|nr:hypothetical protein [Puniceicoccales bacterium]